MPFRGGNEVHARLGTFRPVVDAKRHDGTAPRQVREVYVYRTGTWRLVWDDNYPPAAPTGLR